MVLRRLGCVMLAIVACGGDNDGDGGGAGSAGAAGAMSSEGGAAASGPQAGDRARPQGGAGGGGAGGANDGGSGDGSARDGGAADGSDEDAGPRPVMDPYPGECTDALDYTGDGIFDYRTTSRYDDEGRLVAVETDNGNDGDIDSIRTVEYDAEGRAVRIEVDRGADGTFDSADTHEFRQDGQPLRDVDYDAEGNVTRLRAYSYDQRGFLIEIFESPGSEQRMRYENDDNGCIVVTIQDDGDDAVIDAYSTYTRDAGCRELERVMDFGDDGTIDWIHTHTYDGDGNVLVDRRTENGVVTSETTREYEGGRIARSVAITNGTPTTTSYTYDAAGNLLRIETDGGDDGVMVATTSFELDGRGNTLRVVTDEDGDGSPDSIRESTYDCWE